MADIMPRTGRATIRDVAARAGVATATVSNVLTGRRRVAESLRQVVLEAVDALDYQPNHLAASLRLQRTRSIGVVVPDLTNPFFAGLVRHIEERAVHDGYQILLVDSNEEADRETARVRALLGRRIDGLVLVPTRDEAAARRLYGNAAPTVIIDRGLDVADVDSVGIDNFAASRLGCEHLLALGHRDIALLVTDERLSNIRDRIEGYRRALVEAGCGEQTRIVVGGPTIDGCRAAVERLLRTAPPPTAIFTATYVCTLGAVQAIRALDIPFPNQISVLGFDDFDWMTLLRPYISALRQPVEEMANAAWRLLVARCEGEAPSPSRIRLPCTLEVRESTRPLIDAMKAPMAIRWEE